MSHYRGQLRVQRGNAYHPTKMALHGSLLLEDPGIFSHAGDELMIAYRLIQRTTMTTVVKKKSPIVVPESLRRRV